MNIEWWLPFRDFFAPNGHNVNEQFFVPSSLEGKESGHKKVCVFLQPNSEGRKGITIERNENWGPRVSPWNCRLVMNFSLSLLPTHYHIIFVRKQSKENYDQDLSDSWSTTIIRYRKRRGEVKVTESFLRESERERFFREREREKDLREKRNEREEEEL